MKTPKKTIYVKHVIKLQNKSAAYAVPPLPLSRSERASVLRSITYTLGWPEFPVQLSTSPRVRGDFCYFFSR